MDKKEFAPGIPLDKTVHPLPKVTRPEEWNVGVQKHTTERGGRKKTHFDLRLNPRGSFHAYSWAIPSARLPKPGEKLLAIETFTHTADYMPFVGELRSGYGKGIVERELLSKAEVLRATPDKIVFNIYDSPTPQEFSLFRINKDNWVISNITKTKEKLPKSVKPSMKDLDIDKLDLKSKFRDYAVAPKASGAFSTVYLDKYPRVYSHRISKKNNQLIEYTHKIPKLVGKEVPKDIRGTILQAELIAQKGKRVAREQDIAGILNSKVWKSRQKQKELGELKPYVFNILKYKNKDVSNLPFEEKKKYIKKVVKKLPQLEEMPVETKVDKAIKLLEKIKNKKYWLTSEGVVLYNLSDPKAPMIKSKVTKTYDVYVRGFFDGKGKYKGKAVGGFYYSFTPNGPIVGKLGTGLSDELREDMYKHPDRYIDRCAEVTSQYAFLDDKGNIKALKVPVFEKWHISKGKQPEY